MISNYSLISTGLRNGKVQAETLKQNWRWSWLDSTGHAR